MMTTTADGQVRALQVIFRKSKVVPTSPAATLTTLLGALNSSSCLLIPATITIELRAINGYYKSSALLQKERNHHIRSLLGCAVASLLGNA